MKKIKFKQEKGITLIALIITIIIMLILVSVSINILIKSDLFGTAQNAADKTQTAYEKEGKLSEITIGGKTYSSIEEYLNKDNGDLPKVVAGQKASENSEYSDGKNTTDENAQDINDMYICQGKTADNGACTIVVENGIAKCTNEAHSSEENGVNKNTQMAGRLYATNTGENFEKGYTEVYTAGSGLREPDTISKSYDGNSTYLGYLSDILEASVETENKEYTTIENFKAKLQEEYNEIVKSVYKNQGFYVGRYETSGMKQATTGYEVAVVAGVIPSNKIDWYHLYAEQVNYAKDKNLDLESVGSTMIQGAAYDQVMKFVNTEEYSVTTSGNVGHSFSSSYNTGSQSTDVSKNIFDLEGNVRAWTTEADNTNFRRVYRGGSYDFSSSASYRGSYYPGSSDSTSIGSLAQLYVK